jgi:hypothetical protein
MYLEYGANEYGELIHVGQVPRGITSLQCPYCGVTLLAKKGEIVGHHFAHAGETCRQVKSADFSLPAYDNFNLHLPGRVLTLLKRFHEDGVLGWRSKYSTLEEHGLVKYNPHAGRSGGWELTHKGKVPFGELSLMLFNQFQEPLIGERFEYLQEALRLARERRPVAEARLAEIEVELPTLQNDLGLRRRFQLRKEAEDLRYELRRIMDVQTAMIDLRLYRAQWQRILSTSLYFLEINDGQYYKIGVTTRDPGERISGIRADLTPHLGEVTIKIVDVWPHRGNVELYFKHRYKQFNVQIGTLTEYYQFEDPKAVIRDLRRMKPKALTDLERAILAGTLTPTEERVRLDTVEQKRRVAIRVGMQRVAARGKHIGRPRRAEGEDKILAKHAAVAEALRQGLSLRQAAKASGVAVNTVRKVKAILDRRENS